MQQAQGQLAGSKQQLQLVQDRLSSNGAAQSLAPSFSGAPNSNSHSQPQPPAPGPSEEYGLDQDYAQDYPGEEDGQEADMDFDPPGSAGGLDRDATFDPSSTGEQAAGLNGEQHQGSIGDVGQGEGQQDLYSPGLSAQPSGSYLSEPGFHSKWQCRQYACLQQLVCSV